MHEFTKKKIIWARKSGTILYESNLSMEIAKANKKNFNVVDFNKEDTFKISLFEESNKFEKFSVI